MNDRAVSVMIFLTELISDEWNVVRLHQHMNQLPIYEEQARMFEEDRALFSWIRMRIVENLRSMETDFGILPLPKLSEGQSQYYSISDGFHTSLAVPVTLPREDFGFVGAVIESLNAETYKTVVPAYYDVALKIQGTRDEESKLVLDMIRDGRLVDFDLMYDGWAGFGFALSELMQQRSRNFSSYFEAREGRAQASLERVIHEFERLIAEQ
jgi:hypothetical protein